MIILFVVLELLDLATTVYGLSHGCVEGNPYMAALSVPEMVIWKTLITVIIAVCVWKGWIHRIALFIINPFMIVVVINNLVVISRV